jgi:transposase InsO family protein
MSELGLRGAVRGKVKRTTISDPRAPKPHDLVDRNFSPLAPDRLWVADFTYVSTWSGWCYTAFVIDAYARRILGWSVATTMTSQLVLDAVEQAIWTRGREGRDLAGLIAHHDHGVQYLSLAYSEHLAAAGIKPSTGAVGSSYDNALAESVIGLYTSELIKPRVGRGRASTTSRSPPPNGSTGTTTAGPSSTATTSRPLKQSRLTTLTTTRPRQPSESQTRSLRTRRGGSLSLTRAVSSRVSRPGPARSVMTAILPRHRTLLPRSARLSV